MKSLLLKMVAALVFTAAIAGCGAVKYESAMEWMQKQPNYIDP